MRQDRTCRTVAPCETFQHMSTNNSSSTDATSSETTSESDTDSDTKTDSSADSAAYNTVPDEQLERSPSHARDSRDRGPDVRDTSPDLDTLQDQFDDPLEIEAALQAQADSGGNANITSDNDTNGKASMNYSIVGSTESQVGDQVIVAAHGGAEKGTVVDAKSEDGLAGEFGPYGTDSTQRQYDASTGITFINTGDAGLARRPAGSSARTEFSIAARESELAALRPVAVESLSPEAKQNLKDERASRLRACREEVMQTSCATPVAPIADRFDDTAHDAATRHAPDHRPFAPAWLRNRSSDTVATDTLERDDYANPTAVEATSTSGVTVHHRRLNRWSDTSATGTPLPADPDHPRALDIDTAESARLTERAEMVEEIVATISERLLAHRETNWASLDPELSVPGNAEPEAEAAAADALGITWAEIETTARRIAETTTQPLAVAHRTWSELFHNGDHSLANTQAYWPATSVTVQVEDAYIPDNPASEYQVLMVSDVDPQVTENSAGAEVTKLTNYVTDPEERVALAVGDTVSIRNAGVAGYRDTLALTIHYNSQVTILNHADADTEPVTRRIHDIGCQSADVICSDDDEATPDRPQNVTGSTTGTGLDASADVHSPPRYREPERTKIMPLEWNESTGTKANTTPYQNPMWSLTTWTYRGDNDVDRVSTGSGSGSESDPLPMLAPRFDRDDAISGAPPYDLVARTTDDSAFVPASRDSYTENHILADLPGDWDELNAPTTPEVVFETTIDDTTSIHIYTTICGDWAVDGTRDIRVVRFDTAELAITGERTVTHDDSFATGIASAVADLVDSA